MAAAQSSDVKKLKALLEDNGRAHLRVRDEQGHLVVSSADGQGQEQKHFRLSPAADGYQVSFWDAGDWKKVPIAGALEKVVDALVSSSAGPRAG